MGDCIYYQLDIDELRPISRNDIIRNFDKVFNSKFRNEVKNIKRNPHHNIYTSILNGNDESVILNDSGSQYKYAVAKIGSLNE